MMPVDLLDLPAPLAVRHIALELFDTASAAHARLDKPEDMEALHDFRVALRRLRSWLRVDSWVGGNPPRKISRHIQQIAHATNTARDTEVLLSWATTHRSELKPRERMAVGWLTDWILQHNQSMDSTARIAYDDFTKHLHGWRKSLASMRFKVRVDDPEQIRTFREHAGKLIETRCEDLATAFSAIKSGKDRKHIHRARIASKRLRYAIEPLVPFVDGAEQVVAIIKPIQDEFGFSCDRMVFLQLLETATRAAAKQQVQIEFEQALSVDTENRTRINSAVPGLLGLTRIAAAEERAHYRQLRKAYLGPRTEQILNPVRMLADSLSHHDSDS